MHFYVALVEPTGQIYMDLTGKFAAPSSGSNNYIMIIYDYDRNATLAISIKHCKAESVLAVYKIGYARLCWARLQLQLQCLGNGASSALQDYVTTESINFQSHLISIAKMQQKG